MSDRTMRFAARMIAVGLLGVAWTIGTLTLVIIRQSPVQDPRGQWIAWLGLAPVGLMLIYVTLTDFADYQRHRQSGGDRGDKE
ncbi:MAG: hypothetical protein BIFFINMI_04305 [Phycisphaerae bacterium]|nr:hypothetical protein [Phycisphaerae bacterium]